MMEGRGPAHLPRPGPGANSTRGEEEIEKAMLERIAHIHSFRKKHPMTFYGRLNYQPQDDEEARQSIPGMYAGPFLGPKRPRRPAFSMTPPHSPTSTAAAAEPLPPSKRIVFRLHNYAIDPRFQCRRLDYTSRRLRTDVAPLVPRRLHEDEVLTKRLIVPVLRLKSLCTDKPFSQGGERGGARQRLPNSFNIDVVSGRLLRHAAGYDVGHFMAQQEGGGKRTVVRERVKEDLGDSYNICGFLR